MEGTCKELILDGLSSLFEQGNFSDLLALLKIYDENPGEILTRTPGAASTFSFSAIQHS